MRTLIALGLLLVSAPIGLAAQSTDRYAVYSYTSPQKPVVLYEIANSGAATSTIATLPTGVYPFNVVMAEDNRSFRFLAYWQPSRTGLVLDITPGGTITTLLAGAPLYRPLTMVRDCDGDWILAHQGFTIYDIEIYRLRGTTLTRLNTFKNIYAYVMARDETTGQMVVRGMDRQAPVRYGYFRLDPSAGVVTGFAIENPSQGTPITYGAKEPFFEGHTGAFVDVYYDFQGGGLQLCRAHPQYGITRFPAKPHPWIPGDATRAGQRDASCAYLALGRTFTSPPSFHLIRLKPDGRLAGASPVQGFTPGIGSTLLRIGGRHLTWLMDTPPNGRRLRLSFPGESGLSYVVGLSLGGTRPGIPLPDGRVIPLNPDHLTNVCLLGGVAGILENTVGILDRAGEARVKVDTNAFRGALKGTRIWATAAVFDPAASAGIAYIAGPTLLHIRQ